MRNRDKILKIAFDEFMMKGYESSSINSICQKAGISKGGIYHHFKNKDELYQACLNIFLKQMESWVLEMMQSTINLKEFLFAYFGLMSQVKDELFGANNLEGFSAANYYTMILNGATRYPAMQKQLNDTYEQMVEDIQKLILEAQSKGKIKQDMDVEITAFELVSLFEGTLIMSVMKTSLDLEDIGTRLAENFWNKIKI